MANSDTKELESQAAVDGALFRQLVADGYDQCAEAYLKTHAAHDPDDMRAEPFAQLLATLSEGAHVLDAGCGAGGSPGPLRRAHGRHLWRGLARGPARVPPLKGQGRPPRGPLPPQAQRALQATRMKARLFPMLRPLASN